MNVGVRFLVVVILSTAFLLPNFSFAQETSTESGFCSFMGWLIRPLGFCQSVDAPVVVVTHEKDTDIAALPPENPPSQPAVQVVPVSPTIIEYSTTTQPIYNDVTNEYVTIQQVGVSQDVLNQQIAGVLSYINSLPHQTSVAGVVPTSVEEDTDFVTREYLLKSLDKVYDNQNDTDRSSNSNSSELTDAELSGTTYVDGNLGVGTSAPSSRLTVAGDLYLTGAFRDSGNSAGTDGYILQTTGAGTQWVATSSLGFTTGSSTHSALTLGTNTSSALSLSGQELSLADVFLSNSGDTMNGNLVMNGANIALSGNYLSNDGDDEGIYVNEAGRVGIGTASPAALFNVVDGMVRVDSSATTGQPTFFDSVNSNSGSLSLRYAEEITGSIPANTWQFRAGGTTSPIAFSRFDSEPLLFIDTSTFNGSVGIGTSTPASKLTIAQSTDSSGLRIQGFDDHSGDFGGLSVGGDGFFRIQAGGAAGTGALTGSGNAAAAAWTDNNFVVLDDKTLGFGTALPVRMGYNDEDTTFRIATGGAYETDGNVRLMINAAGNVGVGTTTPESRLTVAGDVSATTITADVLDTGGQVCNVDAYGAVGDNATINDAAIARAIADCPEGGTVFFPMGEYRIATPIVLDRPVTLRGSYAPRWSYSSTPRSSIRANFATFTGVAMVHVRDRTISGLPEHNNGGRLENLSLDGGSAGSDVDGIYFEGLVRDWKLTDVDISQTTGNGFEAAVGTGSGNPRGFTIRGLSIYSADGHGFRATALNDSYIEDLLVVGNALRGIYISSMGETKINNSRAVFNALEGLYIDGASNNGGIMFTDFSTDRNDRHGVRISLTGTTSVTFNGLLTRRDGANLGGGSETPYAGVAIIGTTTEKVAPVFINGLTQIVGVDDSGNPPLAPLVGVRAANAKYVKIEGQLWGVNASHEDGGGNEHFIIEEESIIKTGTPDINENVVPLYNNKWVAATTTKSLLYDGAISIGSSTDSRLLNIVAASGAGARFRDTTNNVTFDMRAEDSQAFFGTFTNHQLRFQTNNTSRLTIDTNGRVGIGTTTPVTNLSVVGDAYFTGALRDSTNNSGSDGFILQTTGLGSRWVATSTLGFTSGGANTFLELTDTPEFYNAGRIPFTNAAGDALIDSSGLMFDGDTLELTSDVDEPAIRIDGPNVNINSVMVLNGPVSTNVGNGKIFQVGLASESFGRGQFYTDGSYGIGPGTATRDTFFSRVSTSTLLISSDRLSGAADLIVTGRVGIGTTTPTTELTVAGVITPDADNMYSLGNSSYRFSEVFSANGVVNTSDSRLKENVATVIYGIDEIMALQPVSFTWVDNPQQGTKLGLLAQNVQELMPEIVQVGDDEDQTLGVRYTEIIPVIINALQEMWQKVIGLEEKVQEIDALRERIESLEREAGVPPAAPVQSQPEENEPEIQDVTEQAENESENEEPDSPLEDTGAGDENVVLPEEGSEDEMTEDVPTQSAEIFEEDLEEQEPTTDIEPTVTTTDTE